MQTLLLTLVLTAIAAVTSFTSFNLAPSKYRTTTQIHGNGKPVEIKFEPSGKVVMAEQGDRLDEIAKKNGVNVPYKCKQGRCTSCEVRINGRVSAKLCQGALVPSGPTKKLIVQVINNKPL